MAEEDRDKFMRNTSEIKSLESLMPGQFWNWGGGALNWKGEFLWKISCILFDENLIKSGLPGENCRNGVMKRRFTSRLYKNKILNTHPADLISKERTYPYIYSALSAQWYEWINKALLNHELL